MAVGSTGISPLRGSLRAAPTCCDGSRQKPFQRSTLWPDRSTYPIDGHGRARCRRALKAGCFSLSAKRTSRRQKRMVRSGCFASQVVAQPLKWLLLLATTMGMCLMNGYSVVKEPQTRLPYVRKEGREFSASLPSSSLISAFYRVLFEIFSQFFNRRQNGLLYRLITATLHFCDLFIGQLLEVIEHQPAPLRIRQLSNGLM